MNCAFVNVLLVFQRNIAMSEMDDLRARAFELEDELICLRFDDQAGAAINKANLELAYIRERFLELGGDD
jgi:hypothetical protein